MKAFDTVDHKILLKKLSFYGIKNNNLKWFMSYLSNKKQYISTENGNTKMEHIFCGIPQGSILGPLLFLIFVNDLSNATLLDLIMFADDTNLFYSNKDIKTMYEFVNKLTNYHRMSIKPSMYFSTNQDKKIKFL